MGWKLRLRRILRVPVLQRRHGDCRREIKASRRGTASRRLAAVDSASAAHVVISPRKKVYPLRGFGYYF
ncbi:hypothetical protein F444_02956 [Phytophthora nicotianae P1976]|uniref:Uncharacterized protein n=1 Tax=Phytophthora nicotianae P1976 TaxID=1317066 RepID=A0A081AVQ0_PHYNI|nr:hypothetical protein F444_02956 [Phytophthora nicotianae P1976]